MHNELLMVSQGLCTNKYICRLDKCNLSSSSYHLRDGIIFCEWSLEGSAHDSFSLFFSGNTDINNGNLKLILGLIWSLIAHYQLGASNFPPKKLMLAWLKVELP